MDTHRLWLVAGIGAGLLGAGAAFGADADKLTEAQAIGVELMSNAGEMQVAQTVAARTTDPKVRAYAMQLIDEHMKSNRDLLGLVEKTGHTAADSGMRDKMGAEAHKEVGKLWTSEPGPAFDKMFLTQAIEDHVDHLNMIDQQLLPAAQTEEVRTAFTKTRTAVQEHLTQACTLGQGMGIQNANCPAVRPGTR